MNQDQDVTTLQVEIALLRERLEEAEKRERAALEAYRDLELMHKPTEEEEAFETLAEAFATIEAVGRRYLADSFYNEMAEAINNLVNDVQWQSKPHLLRRILPALLEEHIGTEEERRLKKAKS